MQIMRLGSFLESGGRLRFKLTKCIENPTREMLVEPAESTVYRGELVLAL